MKIIPHTTASNRKFKLVAISLLSLLLISAAGYYIWSITGDSKNTDNTGIDYSPPTDEQRSAGEEAKENAIDRGTNEPESPEQPPEDLVEMISSYNSQDKTVTVTTKLKNNVTWDKCELVLQQGSAIKSYQVRTVYQQDSSFCGGFTVSMANLSGTWQVILKVSDLNGKVYEELGNVELS